MDKPRKLDTRTRKDQEDDGQRSRSRCDEFDADILRLKRQWDRCPSWQAMDPWLFCPHLRTCLLHPVCGYPGKPHADAQSDILSNLNPKVLKYNFLLCGLQESFMSVQTHLSFIIGRRFRFSWHCFTKSSKSLCTVDKLVFHSWGVWGLEVSASKRWHLTGNPGI